MMRSPIIQILIGFVLVLSAAILAWLIVLGYLASTLFLDLSVFTMSMGGLMLGLVGSATFVKFEMGNKKAEKAQKKEE